MPLAAKELLYKEAIQYYLDNPSEWFSRALSEEQDVRIAFERLVESTATEFTRDDFPAGCMISLAGTHVPPSLDSLRETMISYRCMAEKIMAERLRQGVKQGQIPPTTDVDLLASYFGTVFRGMAVQARDGKSRERACRKLVGWHWHALQRARSPRALRDLKSSFAVQACCPDKRTLS
jgi:hypothetical protein